MTKQRLAILTMDYPPGVGGVQKYLYEISKRLSSNYKVFVVTPVHGDLEETIFQRIVVKSSSPWHFWKALKKIKPDRILLGHAHPRMMVAASLSFRKKFALLTYGNDYLAAQYRWHRNLFNFILSKAVPLITISQNNAEILKDLVSRNPAIVYPGTDPTQFFTVDNKKDHPLVLLSVGRLIPRKGMDLVLEALPKVLKQYPDTKYKIVGDGPDRFRLEQLSMELGVEDVVDFLGYVDNGDLPSIYQNADIFVLPSREIKDKSSIEGFGIVYLEASACGLPVIAGRSGGAVEAVIEGETGILVDPYDPKILGDRIIELIDDPERRERMGIAGREWVVNEMNWDRVASEIYKLLEGN